VLSRRPVVFGRRCATAFGLRLVSLHTLACFYSQIKPLLLLLLLGVVRSFLHAVACIGDGGCTSRHRLIPMRPWVVPLPLHAPFLGMSEPACAPERSWGMSASPLWVLRSRTDHQIPLGEK